MANYTAGEIRDLYELAARDTSKATHEYWMNRSFMFGEQWVWKNPGNGRIEEYPRDPEKVRITNNKLWPASRTLMSKLLRRRLVFEVPPNGSDDANIKAAQKAMAVINDVYTKHDWETRLRTPMGWDMWMGATAGICVEWDPEKGTRIGHDDSGRPLGTGDTRETELSILQMFIEPGAPNAETARWWIKSVGLPPDQVRDMYGLSETPKADLSGSLSPLQARLLANDHDDQTPKDLSMVLSYYERPNKKNEKGCYAVICGDKIIEGPHEWPFPFTDRLNLVVAHETPPTNRWYGETVVTAARPLQTALNASWSSVIEHMKECSNARILMPNGAYDDATELTDLPGEILYYDSEEGKPEWMSPPTMPDWWSRTPTELKQELDDLLSLQDVARGVAPPNIESGLGISILSENNDTPLATFALQVARAFERLSFLVLKIYEDKVTETRTASTPPRQGRSLPPDAKSWTGKELMGHCYVEIPDDAVIPRSRAASEKRAFDLWDRKLITDPTEFAIAADMANPQSFLEGLNPDVAKASRENWHMSIGRAAVPADFDDHTVHVNHHNRFRKSSTYEQLEPEQKKVVDDHIQAHSTLASQEAAVMAAAEEADPRSLGIPTPQGMEGAMVPSPDAQVGPPQGAPQPAMVDAFSNPETAQMAGSMGMEQY
jgi:hypothetical protein